MIVGHRGAKALAPENTLAAIQACADCGVNWIEVDTLLSKDGVPIIFHDETLDRCTDKQGRVADKTLLQIKKADAGEKFAAKFKGETIPTLEEALQLCLQNSMSMNLEIKIHHDYEITSLVTAVNEVIQKLGFPEDRLLLSSFSKLALKECLKVMPAIKRGYITEEKEADDYLALIVPLDLFSVHVNHKKLTKEMAKKIKGEGYQLNIWTMNEPSKVEAFSQMQVDNIITDDPSLF